MGSLMLACLFITSGACVMSDAGGSCALRAGRLPVGKFGRRDGAGRAPTAPAPWSLCVAVDLAIAACKCWIAQGVSLGTRTCVFVLLACQPTMMRVTCTCAHVHARSARL